MWDVEPSGASTSNAKNLRRHLQAVRNKVSTHIRSVNPMKIVTVVFPKEYVKGLHELVRSGMYPSRSAAIRAAVRDMLKKELWSKRE